MPFQVGAGHQNGKEEVLTGSANGLITRTAVANIPVLRPYACGPLLMRLQPGDVVTSVMPIRAAG